MSASSSSGGASSSTMQSGYDADGYPLPSVAPTHPHASSKPASEGVWTAATDTTSAAADSAAAQKRISLHVPTNMLIIPPVAAGLGLAIGMGRGATRARLRFLAENAHRQPKTMQGWYFYTKTRNYRIVLASLKSGGKYAAGLGTAAALYVAADEGMGWFREHLLDPAVTRESERVQPNPRREGWRKGPVHVEDGAVAGAVLALVGGLIYRLPNPLITRGLIMGVILGATTSGLQIAQDKIAELKAVEDAQKEAAKAEADAAAQAAEVASGAAPSLAEGAAAVAPADKGWFSWGNK